MEKMKMNEYQGVVNQTEVPSNDYYVSTPNTTSVLQVITNIIVGICIIASIIHIVVAICGGGLFHILFAASWIVFAIFIHQLVHVICKIYNTVSGNQVTQKKYPIVYFILTIVIIFIISAWFFVLSIK